MIHRAAVRNTGLGRDQRVDAETADEGAVRPDALDYDHPRLQAVEQPRVQADFGQPVTDPHEVAVGYPKGCRVARAEQQLRARREVSVSVKLVLRNCRAGAATRR